MNAQQRRELAAFEAELAKHPAPMQKTIRESMARNESNSWTFFQAGYRAAHAAALEAVGVEPVAQFHAHPEDWQYRISLLPGVPMQPNGALLYGPDVALRLTEALGRIEQLEAERSQEWVDRTMHLVDDYLRCMRAYWAFDPFTGRSLAQRETSVDAARAALLQHLKGASHE